MKLTSLDELLTHELQDLHSAESQLVEALPKAAKAAKTEALKSAIEDHLEVTKGHLERLEMAFETLGQKPNGQECKAMKGLIKEADEMMKVEGDPNVTDAALIAAAQRIEHYEIAGYGTARAHAQECGYDDVAALLQQTRDEEMAANQTLTKIAVSEINPEAANA
ncbi:MAG TPA: ferritin-like domain-containing protein [Fimbriimonadales bacterium]|jgi:ferritin-like metal-binding protein YciE|nr:ferritin-like domain-containing protein [Fimbriimonadales bacterium]